MIYRSCLPTGLCGQPIPVSVEPPFAFQTAGTVNMFPGGSLKTSVTVGCGTTINTALFVMVMLMKPIGIFRTALPVFC